ncbi:GspE/PulE family protein [Akkermansia glycaniphila]|uniref:Type ii/iv secretion system protein n=1 Tax=Akkermansia glycaniphila TaxID=1679444 RepID=A0A1C7PEQ1_9BACT|nr:GspE/PulE family protein [Akkermansia glycaniphila]MBT9449006.1 type II/IV secretion system protein [Akkermansia glycaniphila]OCA04035.1 type II secretion system protein E [Akkermansia glycaniphila]SEH72667.1 type ii/iv secretion system protein [Akkermansia glycaniphila]
MYSNEPYLLDLLVEAGALHREQIEQFRRELSPRQSVIEYIIQNQYLTDEYIAQVCAHSSGMAYAPLDDYMLNQETLALVSPEVARRYKVIPLGTDDFTITCAIADPFAFETLDSLPQILGKDITFAVATQDAINRALENYYPASSHTDHDSALQEDGDAPIIRLVQQMISDAYKMRASDIHIEPMENRLRIRFRIDGKLVEVATHPKKLLSAVIARLKVMSSTMSIAEKRLPQDGRIQLDIGGKQIDLRVSSVPSNHGESIVMRILDKSALVLGLPQLGFFSDDEATFDRLITLPDGIILVTGPTGSGKTTTLYACLNHINRPDKKIITVEDPVEYELSGINQVMVKADIGMTFSAALRSMLRQAPNIIMIGEIRDAETANIAINASLTGHLVFSTLHTNDAPSAVARLADIGVKRFLIASSVRAVMAQRLVRKLCANCKRPGELTEKQARTLNIDMSRLTPGQIQVPVGCATCRGSGTKGRMGLFEIFEIDDEVRHMINEQITTPQLRKRARELGMRTLREDGVRKVLAGLCSAEEVMHVTMGDAN